MAIITFFAPARFRLFTILREVVPRTRESSISIMFLPLMTSFMGASLRRAVNSRRAWSGCMKERPV